MIAIHITLSEEDINIIEKNMEYLNMKNRSAYIRKMATDGRCQVVDPSGLLELNRLMHIAGNNLNQYAKRANQVGAVYRNDILELQEKFQEIIDNQRIMIESFTLMQP